MNSKTGKTILPVLVLLFGLSAIPALSSQEGEKLNALIKEAEQGLAEAQFNLGLMCPPFKMP